MKSSENDSIIFHMTTPHTMQVTMTIGMATAIRDAIVDALAMPEGNEIVLVIDMQADFEIARA